LWLTPLPTLLRSGDLPLKGGGGKGGTRCAHDCLKYTIAILENVGIPEAQYAIAFRLQPTSTPDVMLRFRMLAAVQFDHQTLLVTHKVNDIWADWSLPTEA
jgi:hypothetical protein